MLKFCFRPQTQSSVVPDTKIRKNTENSRNSQEVILSQFLQLEIKAYLDCLK